MKKDSFVLYTNYMDYAEDLPDEEFGRLMRIVFQYVKSGEEPEKDSLSLAVKMLFKVIKNDIDINAEKYENTCKARSEAGKKGGRPKKANGNSAFSEKAKKADNEYDYECDNDNDNEYEGAIFPEAFVSGVEEKSEVLILYKELLGLNVTKRVIDVFKKYDLSDDLKKRAIETAHDNGIFKLSYVTGVMDQYIKQGAKTPEDLENSKNKRQKAVVKSADMTHVYDWDEIERRDFERRLGKAKV